MNWKKPLSALALTSFLFSSSISANAAPFTSPEELVEKAESFAGSLKWAISIEGKGDGRTIPWNYFNGTKNAYQKALSVVSKLPKGKTKSDLLSRLEENVNLYIRTTPGNIGRAVAYIDAITAGQKIETKKNQLTQRLEDNIMDNVTEKYYHELSSEIKKQAYLLDRVYGKSTRDTIRNQFKGSAEEARSNALYPVSIHMALNEFKKDLDIQYYIKAIPFQNEIEALMREASEKGLITNPVYNQLHSKYQQLQELIPTVLDFTLTDIEGKFSSINNLNYEREFKINPEDLNGFDTFAFRLYQEPNNVTLTLSTENVREVVFDEDNVLRGEINLDDFKTKHQITDVQTLSFEFAVTDKLGQTKIETGKLIGFVPYVFTDGTYTSPNGFTIDIPRDYELTIGDNGSEFISNTNEEAGGNWLSIKVLDPNSDLDIARTEAIEFLKSAPGIPEDFDGYDSFTDQDTTVKMHLLVRNKHLTEESLILEIDGHLVHFTFHIDSTYLYTDVSLALKNIIQSVDFPEE